MFKKSHGVLLSLNARHGQHPGQGDGLVREEVLFEATSTSRHLRGDDWTGQQVGQRRSMCKVLQAGGMPMPQDVAFVRESA